MRYFEKFWKKVKLTNICHSELFRNQRCFRGNQRCSALNQRCFRDFQVMNSAETDLKVFWTRADQRWMSLRRQLGGDYNFRRLIFDKNVVLLSEWSYLHHCLAICIYVPRGSKLQKIKREMCEMRQLKSRELDSGVSNEASAGYLGQSVLHSCSSFRASRTHLKTKM